jgi:two-component system chemotaxis response regulator CheB
VQPDPQIIALGVSTGGPNALTQIFRQLPGDLPVPLVVVQHMPPLFTRFLAERLATQTPLQVREGAPGEALGPGRAWVAHTSSVKTIARARDSKRQRDSSASAEGVCEHMVLCCRATREDAPGGPEVLMEIVRVDIARRAAGMPSWARST